MINFFINYFTNDTFESFADFLIFVAIVTIIYFVLFVIAILIPPEQWVIIRDMIILFVAIVAYICVCVIAAILGIYLGGA